MAAKENLPKTNDDAPKAEKSKNGSSFGTLVRVAIILALAYFIVKPYLEKPKEEGAAPQTFKITGETMGTTWNASITASPTDLVKLNNRGIADSENAEDEKYELLNSCEELLARVVQRELDKIDGAASTYRSDSETSQFNRSKSTEWFDVSEDMAKIVAVALDVSQKTNGAFDVTVAPLVNLYHFGPNKAPLAAFPTDEEIERLRSRVGYQKLEVRLKDRPALRKSNPDVSIDLSSVAKGYAVDRVADALEKAGLNDYLVEVGGEIRCRGKKIDPVSGERLPWVLGIQRPEVASQGASARVPDVYRIVQFASEEGKGALATSGDYNNFQQIGDARCSHFIDPRTGKPTEIVRDEEDGRERLGSVAVFSSDPAELSCAQVDAYATAFCVLGEEEGLPIAEKQGIAALFLYRSDDAALQLRESASSFFDATVSSKLADEPDDVATSSEKEDGKEREGDRQ